MKNLTILLVALVVMSLNAFAEQDTVKYHYTYISVSDDIAKLTTVWRTRINRSTKSNTLINVRLTGCYGKKSNQRSALADVNTVKELLSSLDSAGNIITIVNESIEQDFDHPDLLKISWIYKDNPIPSRTDDSVDSTLLVKLKRIIGSESFYIKLGLLLIGLWITYKIFKRCRTAFKASQSFRASKAELRKTIAKKKLELETNEELLKLKIKNHQVMFETNKIDKQMEDLQAQRSSTPTAYEKIESLPQYNDTKAMNDLADKIAKGIVDPNQKLPCPYCKEGCSPVTIKKYPKEHRQQHPEFIGNLPIVNPSKN